MRTKKLQSYSFAYNTTTSVVGREIRHFTDERFAFDALVTVRASSASQAYTLIRSNTKAAPAEAGIVSIERRR